MTEIDIPWAADLEPGEARPAYLFIGDPVLAEPPAEAFANALAERIGCRVETFRRPIRFEPVLSALRTFALFDPGKVVLVVDSGVLADQKVAAEWMAEVRKSLPRDAEQLSDDERATVARLFAIFRLFGLDPTAGEASALVGELPDEVFSTRRIKRDALAKRRDELVPVIEGGRRAGIVGLDPGAVAGLSQLLADGMPSGHHLILVEPSAAPGHPVIDALKKVGRTYELASVSAERRGGWVGLEALVETLQAQTGVSIDRDAARALAERTLRQERGRSTQAEGESTARFAAEYRKLAAAASGRITRRLVEDAVRDRGDQDVWKLLDALGEGKPGPALDGLERLLGSADDAMAARLSFFSLLAGFCRQLVAVRAACELFGVPPGVRNYRTFQSRWVAQLQAPLPAGGTNPIGKLHPYRLHRSYLAAHRLKPETIRRLPEAVLETEMALRGESQRPDAALAELVAQIAAG